MELRYFYLSDKEGGCSNSHLYIANNVQYFISDLLKVIIDFDCLQVKNRKMDEIDQLSGTNRQYIVRQPSCVLQCSWLAMKPPIPFPQLRDGKIWRKRPCYWAVLTSSETSMLLAQCHALWGSDYLLWPHQRSYLRGTWAKVTAEPPTRLQLYHFLVWFPNIRGQVILHLRHCDPGVWG